MMQTTNIHRSIDTNLHIYLHLVIHRVVSVMIVHRRKQSARSIDLQRVYQPSYGLERASTIRPRCFNRLQFMLWLHVYKWLYGISPKNNGQSLRSTDRGQLDVPHPKDVTVWEKSFLVRQSISMELTSQLHLKQQLYSCHV